MLMEQAYYFKGSPCDIVDLQSSLIGELEKALSASDSECFITICPHGLVVLFFFFFFFFSVDIKQKCDVGEYLHVTVLGNSNNFTDNLTHLWLPLLYRVKILYQFKVSLILTCF